VVDTGVDLTHPDLAGQLVTGTDLVEPGTDPLDENGHGTHVAGIAVAATNNGIGIAGASPAAKVMPIRVPRWPGSRRPDDDRGGHRLGGGQRRPGDQSEPRRHRLERAAAQGGQINGAIRRAYAAGAVVVAAAGNDGAALRSYRFGVPVIVVNAVDSSGTVAEFSNYGDYPRCVRPWRRHLVNEPDFSQHAFRR